MYILSVMYILFKYLMHKYFKSATNSIIIMFLHYILEKTALLSWKYRNSKLIIRFFFSFWGEICLWHVLNRLYGIYPECVVSVNKYHSAFSISIPQDFIIWWPQLSYADSHMNLWCILVCITHYLKILGHLASQVPWILLILIMWRIHERI